MKDITSSEGLAENGRNINGINMLWKGEPEAPRRAKKGKRLHGALKIYVCSFLLTTMGVTST